MIVMVIAYYTKDNPEIKIAVIFSGINRFAEDVCEKLNELFDLNMEYDFESKISDFISLVEKKGITISIERADFCTSDDFEPMGHFRD